MQEVAKQLRLQPWQQADIIIMLSHNSEQHLKRSHHSMEIIITYIMGLKQSTLRTITETASKGKSKIILIKH
jgi:hypothetical protein